MPYRYIAQPKTRSRFDDVNVYEITVSERSVGAVASYQDVSCLPYSSNRHVTQVSVRGRKGLTCSIRAPPRPRFDALRQTVSNRAQLFLAVYIRECIRPWKTLSPVYAQRFKLNRLQTTSRGGLRKPIPKLFTRAARFTCTRAYVV